MPYALFEDRDKLSRDYATYEDAWRHAEDSGLVDVVGEKKVLADGYTIEPCLDNDVAESTVAGQWSLPLRLN